MLLHSSRTDRSAAVLITGASSGIGNAAALSLAERGFRVYAGVRKSEDLERLHGRHSNITPVLLDVTKEGTAIAVANRIREEAGELFGLVNNAGHSLACPLEFTPIDHLRKQFEVNVFGQLAVSQIMLPLLRMAKGRIVNVTSLSGYVSGPFVGPYAASKHAFVSLSESLRLELRRQGVQVIQIIPGDIKTPIWDKSRQAADTLRDEIADTIRLRLSDEVQQSYADDIQAMRTATTRFAEKAIPVQRVVSAIYKALVSPRPSAHYIVGARAWGAVRILRLLPRMLRDRILLNNLGMKS